MLEEVRRYFRNGSPITRLILANVIIFVMQSIILLGFTIAGSGTAFSNFLTNLYFPAELSELFRQPWTLITYQFLHDPVSIFHILFNMLYLYWFGRILTDFLHKRYIVPLYLTGGIIGAFSFMLIFNISPSFQTHAYILGASGSVLAIVAAAATLVPDYTVNLVFIGPVRLKWIALIAVLIDVIGVSAGGNAGGHLAHLGGALTGFLFIRSYRMGLHWFDGIIALYDNLVARFRRQPRVVYVRRDEKPRQKQQPGRPDAQQAKMDAILDKINQSGYDSLSKEEKDFLFRMSKD